MSRFMKDSNIYVTIFAKAILGTPLKCLLFSDPCGIGQRRFGRNDEHVLEVRIGDLSGWLGANPISHAALKKP